MARLRERALAGMCDGRERESKEHVYKGPTLVTVEGEYSILPTAVGDMFVTRV